METARAQCHNCCGRLAARLVEARRRRWTRVEADALCNNRVLAGVSIGLCVSIQMHARLRRAARPGLSGFSLYTPVPARSVSLTPCGAVLGWTWGVSLHTCCVAPRRRQLAKNIPPCSPQCGLSRRVMFRRNGRGCHDGSPHRRFHDSRALSNTNNSFHKASHTCV